MRANPVLVVGAAPGVVVGAAPVVVVGTDPVVVVRTAPGLRHGLRQRAGEILVRTQWADEQLQCISQLAGRAGILPQTVSLSPSSSDDSGLPSRGKIILWDTLKFLGVFGICWTFCITGKPGCTCTRRQGGRA